MQNALKNIFLGLFSAGLLFIAYIVLGLIQIGAFLAGLQVWFGLGTVLSLLVFIAVFLFAGPLGGLFIAIVGFYGAINGWGWAWWQAALLCFPFVCLSLALLASAGLGGFWLLGRNNRNKLS